MQRHTVTHESNNNTLSYNTANNDSIGIYIYTHSSHNMVTDNTANSNTNCGITLSPYCTYNTVTGNTVTYNNPQGHFGSVGDTHALPGD